MFLLSFISVLLLTVAVNCEESEKAKVHQVKENSTITFIKFTNNGAFNVNDKSLVTHRVASAQDQQVITQCGGIFRNLQNLIESPKFISPRPICNLRCEYQIVSPYICENEFHVQFLDFAIDSSPDCENDRVIINYSEIMCGKIIGVKKFRTLGGVLNITFSSKLWDLKQGKNFRLLVTRLPCVDDTKEHQTEVDSLEPTAPKVDDSEHRCFQVNSSYGVEDPNLGQGKPIYGVPVNNRRVVGRQGDPIYGVQVANRPEIVGRQDIPVLPLPPQPQPTYPVYPIDPQYPTPSPPFIPQPVAPILPPQFLPQCCRNILNQQRFLLISQGFPAYALQNNDCIFVIQRNSPGVCRLRIIFKQFLLDDPQQGQLGCINNFLEIDGQRICGCNTNFVYETQWGLEPKVLRLRTFAGRFENAQGFVLEVIQEQCPFKIQENQRREVRFIKPEKVFLHPLLNNRQDPTFSFAPTVVQGKSDIDDNFKSKFYQGNQNNYNGNVCVINHLRLFQLKLEYLAVPKQYCLPYF